MFYDFAVIIKPENIYAGPFAVAGPLLSAMEHDVIIFGDNPLKINPFARIFLRHPVKISDKCRFAVGYRRIMLDIDLARIAQWQRRAGID